MNLRFGGAGGGVGELVRNSLCYTAARERLGCPHGVYTSDKTDKHTGMMNAAKERWTMLLLVGGLVAGVMGPKSGKNEWPLTRL